MFLQVIDNYELDYINQPINFLQINIFSKFNSILLFLLWNIFWNQTIYISLIKFKTFLIHDREIRMQYSTFDPLPQKFQEITRSKI